jgi:hypothetical protein
LMLVGTTQAGRMLLIVKFDAVQKYAWKGM